MSKNNFYILCAITLERRSNSTASTNPRRSAGRVEGRVAVNVVYPEFPMRGFVKGVRLRRTPSLPPSHLVPIRILSRRRGVGCLLKSVFRLPLMPRTHRSECRNAVTGTGCKLTLDRRPSSTFAAFSNQNPSSHFRSFLSKSQMPSSYSRLVHHVPIRILSR